GRGRRQPSGTAVRRRSRQSCLGHRHHLHPHPRRLAVPGAVMDLFSRTIVGWAMGSTLHTDLMLQALMMAVWRRKPPAGLLIHSDQGTQYAGHDWQDFLTAHGLVSS